MVFVVFEVGKPKSLEAALQYIPNSMEKTKPLTPICFLKSQQMREKYECVICNQVCVKPVRCKGGCRRVYCMKCVSDWRQTRDVCPLKCSSPFLVDPIPDIMLEFGCPYNPTQCTSDIRSLKEFDSHYKICPFVPPDEIHRRRLKQEYKCRKGHQLQFFIGSYEEMLQSTCEQCGEQLLCRSICRVCDELYCVQCRIPPCSREDCPIGHKYNYQKIANLNYICDLCGISTSVSNDGVYDDTYCNFGICEGCYATLPEHFDPSKPRGLIANINTLCSCGDPLTEIDSLHQQHTCALCLKQKQCPKQCKTCRKYFCLRCKNLDIENDGTCGKFDHQLILLNLKKFPLEVQIQNELGCMRCLQKVDEYYFDRKCKVRLCTDCFNYNKQVTGDKKRCVVLKCDLNHVLSYIAGPNDHISTCSECNKEKIIKLRCYVCQEERNGEIEPKSYCFECRPIKLDNCYFNHKLKLAKFEGERQCHFCCKESSQFYYCRKCYFYVCKQCVGFNQKKFSQEMQVEQDPPYPSEEKAFHKSQKMEVQLASIKIQ